MHTRRNPLLVPAAALLSVFVLAGCGNKDNAAAYAASPPPLPVVTVMVVQSELVPLVTELPGRTTPYLIAELRPQVGGIVQQRAFTEGSEVRAGQLLYRIDAAPYQAAYDSAKANLARAEANRQVAKVKAERYAGLVRIQAVSKQANDDAQAALQLAQADIAAAKAALDKTRIDLDHTQVKSPISGRIGRSSVTQGALVTANQAAALATVQQLDPIYVDLTQSSADMLRIRRDLAAGTLQRNANAAVPVTLVLEDGSEYASAGSLAFSEVTVDENTGSVTLRAKFPNPKGELLPGMYVRARLPQGVRSEAILVPHAALTRDARGKALVMVVDAESTVQARAVQVAQSLDAQWVVTDGLQPGERIIVEGLQKVRPGASVQAEEAQRAPATPSAAPAAPAAN